jgi:predicted outer membrane repeat protein
VSQSSSGDRILVAAGIYTESLTIDRTIEIRGQGAEGTIIQAAPSPGSVVQRVIFVEPSRSLTLRHLTIRHGYADGSSSASRRGGGVYLDAGELELEHVALVANRARGDGGAIYSTSGSISAIHADFRGNWACQLEGSCGDGGAIRNSNGSVSLVCPGLAGLVLHRDGRRLETGDGREIVLTRMEFDLLCALADAPGRVLSRDQLLFQRGGRCLLRKRHRNPATQERQGRAEICPAPWLSLKPALFTTPPLRGAARCWGWGVSRPRAPETYSPVR